MCIRDSYYLTRLLLDADIQVKIIEMNRDRCKELADAFPKAMIIYGDGSDRETLHEENIDDTDALDVYKRQGEGWPDIHRDL